MLFSIFLVVCSALRVDHELVSIPLNPAGEVEVSEIIAKLADQYQIEMVRPQLGLTLATKGAAAGLTRTFLVETLGRGTMVEFAENQLRIKVGDPQGLQTRLKALAELAEIDARRRALFGMGALASYRPNDPNRPTVCLVHGLNSGSGVFAHMIQPLEAAGFGIVVYDFPYNRDLDASSIAFARDWDSFRKARGDTLPWSIVAHSMGSLIARSYVEGEDFSNDVKTLVLIAPANGGSELAGAQTILQLIETTQAIQGSKKSNPLAKLADGLGEAAIDLTPGSRYLTTLNARPRRSGVRYHILAGNAGFLTATARRQVEAQLAMVGRAGLLGGLARQATKSQAGRLDELTEGLGDGCMAVARTKLDGVLDHVVIRANHLELIRAPLIYPEPGPVVSMPYLLKWLKNGAEANP